MALTESFPGPPAVVDSVELRKDLNGQIARDTSGNARSGIFPRNASPLLVARSDMQVDVLGFDGAAVRGGGPLFMQNDGTIQVTIGTAPVSNSRIDVIYFQQQENGYNSFADGNNTPRIAVLPGTAAPIPAKPSLAAIPGAEEIGTVQIASGSTATNQGGVTITTTARFTASSGGVVWVRNSSELGAWAPADGALAWQMDTATLLTRSGGAWEGAWTAYTPILTSTAGTPTLGTSIVTGEYRKNGKTIEFRIFFQLGTGFANTAGSWRFSVPFVNGGARTPIAGHVESASVGFYPAVGYIENGVSIIEQIANSSAAGATVPTSPALAVGSKIALAGTYRTT